MDVKTDLPRAVRVIAHTWIPMSDGCMIAARIWLPVDAERSPVPAILEYIPYRKNDDTAPGDVLRHPYVAGHGYASVRVDMRGSGDSGGLLLDEYLPQEQDDALEVLAWIAAQWWCTGAIGMIGYSWGGFSGLQVTARRPPQLKAVISINSTDDRYGDDVHYMGGCLLAADALIWASIMFAYNARPPDPAVLGDRWRAVWHERLERTPPYIEAWLAHQRRDAYWAHGSVRENYAAIACPVYAVGGWADGYRGAVLRLLAGLPGPRKGLIGPWAHGYPDEGVPGPAIGFLQECLRWWDHWLKGLPTGIMEEPMLRAWMPGSDAQGPGHLERAGRWVAEPIWPPPDAVRQSYALGAGTLDETPTGSEVAQECRGEQRAGRDAGAWCPYGDPTDFPTDQRGEDGRSLTFTSAPLAATMEILGVPEVTLTVAADRPQALLAVRLCAVAPTGASTLVARGLLNLAHRDGNTRPTPLESSRRYTVTVPLGAIAYALPAGHRWRVAVSPTYWPWAWPSPEPATLTVTTGGDCRLVLPVRPPRPSERDLAPFGRPEGTPPLAIEITRPHLQTRTIQEDVASGRVDQHVTLASGFRLADSGLSHEHERRDTYTIVEGNPLSAEVRCTHTIRVGRGDWQTRIETASTMSADATDFHTTNVLEAYEGDVRVFAKTWACTTPRDHL